MTKLSVPRAMVLLLLLLLQIDAANRSRRSVSDRVRDIPAGAAHGERGQDHHKPARGVAPAHPGLRGRADSGWARRVGAGHAAA